MKKSFFLAVAPALLAAATAGHAQTKPVTAGGTSQTSAAAAVNNLSRGEVVKELGAAFARADSNKDASISVAEANAAQQRLATQTAANLARRAEQQFATLDTDKSGQISLAEVKAAMGKVNLAPGDQIVKLLDTNKDGKVSLAEFEAQRLQQFDRVDANRDGTVTPQERQTAAAQQR